MTDAASDAAREKAANSDLLILVDEGDEVLGYDTKGRCHNGAGILHRAFSIFIFNEEGKLLLQKRSEHKRLWGGFWSNTCCSHPRKGEEIIEAAGRRLQEELGCSTTVQFLYKFVYQARFGEAGSEYELCSVLVGKSDSKPEADPAEIAEFRYVGLDELDQELERSPGNFTPWFKMEWKRLRSEFAAELG